MVDKNKYNIVVVNHHSYAPDVGSGGRHYDISKLLTEQGHRVAILASSYSRGEKKYFINDEVNVKKFSPNFSFIRFKTKPAYSGAAGRFLNYRDFMKKTANYNKFEFKPDVIIASSVHPLAWISGYKLSMKYKAKFIVEVRDLWPLSMHEDLSGLKRFLAFSYFEHLERKYYRLADAIITTAPYAFEYMEEKYGIDKNKVFYIPHGIDINEFDNQVTDPDIELDKNINDTLSNFFCVTYTGSLSKSEGLSALVESAKYFKDNPKIKFIVVGAGQEKAVLDKIIQEDALNNVVLFGKQPKSHMAKILSKSGILFVGLMEREAFKYGISKNKFYEYMAAKKPIIFASNVRGSLIAKANCGITIEPHNPKLLAEKISYIYDNYETKGNEYAYNGRKFVENYHTVDKITEKFLEVIEKTFDVKEN